MSHPLKPGCSEKKKKINLPSKTIENKSSIPAK